MTLCVSVPIHKKLVKLLTIISPATVYFGRRVFVIAESLGRFWLWLNNAVMKKHTKRYNLSRGNPHVDLSLIPKTYSYQITKYKHTTLIKNREWNLSALSGFCSSCAVTSYWHLCVNGSGTIKEVAAMRSMKKNMFW